MSRLNNLTLNGVLIPNAKKPKSIVIEGGLIKDVSDKVTDGIDMTGYMAFPGLINMHDHLAFNLFPPLVNRVYANYKEWGADVHEKNKDLIREVLNVPVDIRVAYGELKNIIAGVTTVCDHEVPQGRLKVIDGFSEYSYMHSVDFTLKWVLKLIKASFNRKPLMLHINEGEGNKVEQEFDFLDRVNFLGKRVVGIHGVSLLNYSDAIPEALIWCPGSNEYMYNKTAPILDLVNRIPVFFGTDSTATGDPNVWQHIRYASDILGSTEQVFKMLTSAPCEYFPLLRNKGVLASGKDADIVIAKKKAEDYWEAFYSINPEDILFVIKSGKIIYHKDGVISPKSDLHKVSVLGASGYLLKSFMERLMESIEIKGFVPPFEVKKG